MTRQLSSEMCLDVPWAVGEGAAAIRRILFRIASSSVNPDIGTAVLHPGLESLTLICSQGIAAVVVPDNNLELSKLFLVHDCAVLGHEVWPSPLLRNHRQRHIGCLDTRFFAKSVRF